MCFKLEVSPRIQNKAGCDKLVNEIKAKETKIHVLVNNSGMSWGAPIDRYTSSPSSRLDLDSHSHSVSLKRKAGTGSSL